MLIDSQFGYASEFVSFLLLFHTLHREYNCEQFYASRDDSPLETETNTHSKSDSGVSSEMPSNYESNNFAGNYRLTWSGADNDTILSIGIFVVCIYINIIKYRKYHHYDRLTARKTNTSHISLRNSMFFILFKWAILISVILPHLIFATDKLCHHTQYSRFLSTNYRFNHTLIDKCIAYTLIKFSAIFYVKCGINDA